MIQKIEKQFRKKNGITMISLIIAIIVLVVVTNVLIYSAKDNIEIDKINKMNNDIDLIEGKVNTYYLQNDAIPTVCKYINTAGINIGANDTGDFYVIDLEKLDGLTLNFGKDYYKIKEDNQKVNELEDVYIINSESNKVYYVKGVITSNGSKKLHNDELVSDAVEVEYEEIEVSGGEWNGTLNTPMLDNGMIPIKYNGTNWEVCEVEDKDWYNYNAQEGTEAKDSKWANIMLSDGIYKSETVKVGQNVKKEELGSMFVWIPRYAYNITEGYHSSGHGKIDIKFISTDIKSEGDILIQKENIKISNSYGNGKWNIPSAFQFAGKELPGFYIAKFEASGEAENIKIVPGAKPLDNIDISTFFTQCIQMSSKKDNKYGITEGVISSHMIKNSEWGAVAYLADSKYGRKGEKITINNSSNKTGGNGTYESNTVQTTTGNITGVYDMSGGSYEYVAAYVNNTSNNIQVNGEELISNKNAKYVDVYTVANPETQTGNYDKSKSLYADAIYETSSSESNKSAWNAEYSSFPYSDYPFFVRSGGYDNGQVTGLFYFGRYKGIGEGHRSSRPVLSLDN